MRPTTPEVRPSRPITPAETSRPTIVYSGRPATVVRHEPLSVVHVARPATVVRHLPLDYRPTLGHYPPYVIGCPAVVRVHHVGHWRHPWSYPWYHGCWIGGFVGIYGVCAPSVVVREVEVVPVRPALVAPTAVYVSRQDRLIDELLRGSTEEERRAAARELGDYNNVSAVAALVDALINDGSDQVRQAAARSLGEIGDPLAYEALVRSAEADDQTAALAKQAAEAIANRAGRDSLYVSPRRPPMNTGDAKLGDRLQDLRFGDAKTRRDAAGDLHDYPGTQAVAALIDALVNDRDSDVRQEAAKTLGKIGDRMGLGFLKWSRDNDIEKSVQKDADKAVEKVYNTIQ